ncbi:VOC family protein [Frankia sp. CNm7]|uniref:Aldoketomutase n=1 Tax=Frankia nepalensis TaxID=1836974 RepID=A0A937UV38_9ACTN|nr:VOC family protein [Frankia nepalensis]MBL7495313.1 VOC family protein [Frankia nepalensis]MBL7509692.1 VOC family protein [Frankia nepalensis]MBL7517627.1 VOC family protein [Frankia nepalensis]MBL7631846.1 VOC family protein [Frankia nepalensis]
MVAIIGQFCVNVSDLERSVAFWENVIGIPVVSRTEIETAREAVLQSPHGGGRMQLAQQLAQTGPIDMGSAFWKLYVNTDDCAALFDKTVAAGCEVVVAPARLERWPVTVALVTDLDGYLLELIEYHQDTPAGVPDPKNV